MNNRREKLEAIFEAAAALESEAHRRSYLDRACPDAELRGEVESLLEALKHPDSLFDQRDTDLERTLLTTPVLEQPGTIIGRYKLLQKVGEGGMGVVYMAEQTEPVTRKVALKIIKLGMDTKQVVARFEAERQALALMDHPNIARVLDAGATDTGRPYFVMELVRGVPITEYCDRNKLSTRERLQLFIPVCQAIQHAHQKGVIHRDIKPSNVMVTLHDGSAVPKVIDFGIAKATNQKLTEKTLFTNYAQMIGTPAYMSPEQAEMSGLDVDTRTDVYSLGVLLYELLTGTTPFPSRELLSMGYGEMQRIIAEKEPPRPSTRLSTMENEEQTVVAKNRNIEVNALGKVFRGDLDWIVMKALEKDRTHRYETASGLVSDIRRHLDNEPVSAAAPTFRYQLSKFARRNRKYMRAAAVIAGLLVIAAVFSTYQAVRATRARTAEEAARRAAQEQRGIAVKKQAEAIAEKTSADGNARLAEQRLYAGDMNLAQQAIAEFNWGRAAELLDRHRPGAGEEDLRGWEWRYLWQQIQAEPHDALPTFDHTLISVSYSPDGRFLAVGFHKDGAELWDVKRKCRVKVLAPPGRTTRCVYDPTGARLAVYREDGNNDADRDAIVLWNARTHEKETELPAPDGFAPSYDVRHLAFSRNGEMVAAYFQGYPDEVRGNCYVAVWDVATGRALWHKKAEKTGAAYSGFVGAVCFGPDDKTLFVGDFDGRIYCRDVRDGSELSKWQAYGNKKEKKEKRETGSGLACLTLSPDGRLLASSAAYRDPVVKLWDAETGEPRGVLTGHQSWVASLQFSADGRKLYSAGSDTTLRIWDVDELTLDDSRGGHWGSIGCLSLSPDGTQVATACADGNLFLWNAGSATGTRFSQSRQFEPLDSPELISKWQKMGSVMRTRYAISADGRLLFTLGTDGQIVRSDPETLEPLGEIPEFGSWARLWFVDDSSRIVVGHDSQTQVFRLEPLTLERDLDGFQAESVSSDGRLLRGKMLATGEPRILNTRTWEPTAPETLPSLDRYRSNGNGIGDRAAGTLAECLSAGLVAVQGDPGSVTILDLTQSDPALVETKFVDHGRRSIRRMAFSPDGQLLATCSESGETHVWRRSAKVWTRVANIRGRGAPVDLAFSTDSLRLITTGGETNAITLWDTATWQELITLDAPGAVLVGQAQLLNDGRTLIAVSYDHGPMSLRVWHAPAWEEIAKAEAAQRENTAAPAAQR